MFVWASFRFCFQSPWPLSSRISFEYAFLKPTTSESFAAFSNAMTGAASRGVVTSCAQTTEQDITNPKSPKQNVTVGMQQDYHRCGPDKRVPLVPVCRKTVHPRS